MIGLPISSLTFCTSLFNVETLSDTFLLVFAEFERLTDTEPVPAVVEFEFATVAVGFIAKQKGFTK